MIVIDEVHNIRIAQENTNKKVATQLLKLVMHVDNMRLLLLSATPMYNSFKEIIWLTNLMNINDKRSIIKQTDVFNDDGTSRVQEITLPGKGHSVLTLDFVNENGHPTREALANVLQYFEDQLRPLI